MAALRRFRYASVCLALFVLLTTRAGAQHAGLLPFIDPQFFDDNGNPLSYGSLSFYNAGTTNFIEVFGSPDFLTTPLSNPLPLDSAGRTTTNVYLQAANYKVVLKDANGLTVRTADNVGDTAYLAQLAVAPIIQTTTLTGTANDFALSSSIYFGGTLNYSTIVLRCNNASTLFITGFSSGIGGQRLIVLSVGAGDVFLFNQSASSLAQNRMINLQSGVSATPLIHGAGVAEFIYDDVTFRWRMMRSEMGNFGTYTPTWTGTVSNPSIGNGTLTGRYLLNGRICYVDIDLMIGSTTVVGSGRWDFSLPINAVDTTAQVGGSAMVLDNTTRFWHLIPMLTTVNKIFMNMIDDSAAQAGPLVPMTWTTNDHASISMWYFVP